MRCAWNELRSVLPEWIRRELGQAEEDGLQELRLRLGSGPELVIGTRRRYLDRTLTAEDLKYCVNTASQYSPWSAASAERGYLTAPGGHRIGLCGEATVKDGRMTGLRTISSLCIRVARDYPGLARKAVTFPGSVLILGAPGWGKTTLLRDLIRQLSDSGEHVAVVDERGELFPPAAGFHRGRCTDVLTGCGKPEGIENVLRTMGPDCIAVDEITAPADCEAILHGGWCGVRLLATVHAASLEDLRGRSLYRPLWETGLFPNIVIMRKDKTWYLERMNL